MDSTRHQLSTGTITARGTSHTMITHSTHWLGEPVTRWTHTAPTGSGNQSHGSHTAPTGSGNQSDVGHTLHSLLAVTVKASCTLVVRRLCTCTKCTVEWLYSQRAHVAAVQLYKTQDCSQHKLTFLDRLGYEVRSKCTRTYPCSVSLQQA